MPRLSAADEKLRANLIERVRDACGCREKPKGERHRYPILTCHCGKKWEVRSPADIECVCGATITPPDLTPVDWDNL